MKGGANRWRPTRSDLRFRSSVVVAALCALCLGGCRELGIKKRHEGPVTLLVLATIPLVFVGLFVARERKKKQDQANLASFAATRGLGPETQNSVGGTIGDLKVRYQHIVDYGGGGRTLPTRFEFAAYGPHSAQWPGESSVIFRAEPTLLGFSLPEAHIAGVPTAVDPTFDQQRKAYTRFPVPAVNQVGQRLDGPHLIALPHHRRLAHLPMDAALRGWLLHRDWDVSVYAGRILVRSAPSSPGHTVDVDEALALCRLVSQQMAGWAECIRQAQVSAA